MEEDTRYIKLTPLPYISRDTKNITSWGGSYGCQGKEKYTKHWYLDQLKPNKKKEKKDKMSD